MTHRDLINIDKIQQLLTENKFADWNLTDMIFGQHSCDCHLIKSQFVNLIN
jgi:hypothetical protein